MKSRTVKEIGLSMKSAGKSTIGAKFQELPFGDSKAAPETRPVRDIFHQIDDKDLLILARDIRSPELALFAELHHLHFVSGHKDKPLELSWVVWRWADFNPRIRVRALKRLEKLGLVEVEWRKGKSPLVTLRHQNCVPEMAFYEMGLKASPEAKALMAETVKRLELERDRRLKLVADYIALPYTPDYLNWLADRLVPVTPECIRLSLQSDNTCHSRVTGPKMAQVA